MIEARDNGKDSLLYWEVGFPFPMSNRDYVYRRRYDVIENNGKFTMCIICNAETSTEFRRQEEKCEYECLSQAQRCEPRQMGVQSTLDDLSRI